MHDVTLGFLHTSGESLTSTADTLSHWHMGELYKDMVQQLVNNQDVWTISVHGDIFVLSADL